MSKKLYLDYASTTPVHPEVLQAMLPYFSEHFGNPESLHSFGIEAKKAVDVSREQVAKFLSCKSSEIIFCGSATEANNIAIVGFCKANRTRGTNIVTSKIEHPSVLNTFKHLEKEEGFIVTYLDTDHDGFISLEQLESAITKETILVSIMSANNEIGTIQPIKEVGEICKKHNVAFHTDACQLAEYFKLDTAILNATLLTINGSKLYGPKGIATLYIKQGTKIEPIIYGGEHEHGLRSGTHNVPGIVGLGKACEIASQNRNKELKRLTPLRDLLIQGLLKTIPNSALNGSLENRLPNNINITIPNIESKELLLHLNEAGLCVSAGSACGSGKNTPSHVLKALGLKDDLCRSSIRISLGLYTTDEDIDYILKILPEIVKKLR